MKWKEEVPRAAVRDGMPGVVALCSATSRVSRSQRRSRRPCALQQARQHRGCGPHVLRYAVAPRESWARSASAPWWPRTICPPPNGEQSRERWWQCPSSAVQAWEGGCSRVDGAQWGWSSSWIGEQTRPRWACCRVADPWLLGASSPPGLLVLSWQWGFALASSSRSSLRHLRCMAPAGHGSHAEGGGELCSAGLGSCSKQGRGRGHGHAGGQRPRSGARLCTDGEVRRQKLALLYPPDADAETETT